MEKDTGGAAAARARIFHVHPSLRCNFRCAHCYSSSAPDETDALPLGLIVRAIEDAAGLGYEVLSVSGGEPLMYDGLGELLDTARGRGMRTQVVTNGWYLADQRYDVVADRIDLLAVSLDGAPAYHNRLRQSERSFDRLRQGLERHRNSGRQLGIIHTVTGENWDGMVETAELARGLGAQFFQMHLVEVGGRAEQARELWLSPDLAERILVAAAVLKIRYCDEMPVLIDLLHRDQLASVLAGETMEDALDILVLEANGRVVPLAYGLDPAFSLCDLREQPLSEGWVRFSQRLLPEFLRLRQSVADQLTAESGPAVFNWYEHMVRESAIWRQRLEPT